MTKSLIHGKARLCVYVYIYIYFCVFSDTDWLIANINAHTYVHDMTDGFHYWVHYCKVTIVASRTNHFAISAPAPFTHSGSVSAFAILPHVIFHRRIFAEKGYRFISNVHNYYYHSHYNLSMIKYFNTLNMLIGKQTVAWGVNIVIHRSEKFVWRQLSNVFSFGNF